MLTCIRRLAKNLRLVKHSELLATNPHIQEKTMDNAIDQIYTGFNDDIVELLTPELTDDAAMQAAWEEWCAQFPDGEFNLEDF